MNIEIKISKKPIDYQSAINFLEKRVQDICNHKAKELLWILEHQNIYTCGISGKPEELLKKISKWAQFKSQRDLMSDLNL